MAQAYECDRCKKLFPIGCIPKFRISRWSPAHGGILIDLCPECTEKLEQFLDNNKTKGESE